MPPHENTIFWRAAGADQLVVDDVGCHPHEGQVAATLADDLVAGRVGDEVGEALECDGVTVVDVVCDGLAQAGDRGVWHVRRAQKSTGYCGARPVAMSSGSSLELFSHTSSIERFGE